MNDHRRKFLLQCSMGALGVAGFGFAGPADGANLAAAASLRSRIAAAARTAKA